MYQAKVLEKDVEKHVPKPRGYKILIATPEIADKIGSVHIPDQFRKREETASIIGRVIDMGADAYSDKDKFSKPYCEVGDWVIFRAYSGTRIKVGGQEFRLINDDSVEAVVDDPSLYERV